MHGQLQDQMPSHPICFVRKGSLDPPSSSLIRSIVELWQPSKFFLSSSVTPPPYRDKQPLSSSFFLHGCLHSKGGRFRPNAERWLASSLLYMSFRCFELWAPLLTKISALRRTYRDQLPPGKTKQVMFKLDLASFKLFTPWKSVGVTLEALLWT